MARHRSGEEGGGRCRGLGRQYRRADGDGEVLPAHRWRASIGRRIAAIWPTMRGESIVLDVGATIGADAQHLRRPRGDGRRDGARRLRRRPADASACSTSASRRSRASSEVQEAGPHAARRRPRRSRLSRLRRGRRYRQGHGRRGGHGGLHRQHRAEDRRRHGQADRRTICAPP